MRVGSLDDLEIGTAVKIEVGDAKVAVVRAGDAVYAVADRCSHANYSLSAGAVDPEAWDHRLPEAWCAVLALHGRRPQPARRRTGHDLCHRDQSTVTSTCASKPEPRRPERPHTDASRSCGRLTHMAEPDRKRLLDESEIEAALAELGGWERRGDAFARSLVFGDFTDAFSFMTGVALIAERLFHHPEWSNVWNRVELAITNHDAGGLTELDVEFCRRVDELARRSDG